MENLLYSWAPVILMIGFWAFFMRRLNDSSQGRYYQRSMAFMDRQEQLLERIAAALEQRSSYRQ